MSNLKCAICGKPVVKSKVCRKCRQTHDLTEAWAQALLNEERTWRNALARDEAHGTVTFSDYTIVKDGVEFDGWDILDGEIGQGRTSEPFVNAMGVNDIYFITSDEFINWQVEHLLYEWADAADLTEGELNAMWVYLFASPGDDRFTSEHAAEHLSAREGKTVNPAAYRRRLADARKKLKQVINETTKVHRRM